MLLCWKNMFINLKLMYSIEIICMSSKTIKEKSMFSNCRFGFLIAILVHFKSILRYFVWVKPYYYTWKNISKSWYFIAENNFLRFWCSIIYNSIYYYTVMCTILYYTPRIIVLTRSNMDKIQWHVNMWPTWGSEIRLIN